MAGPDGTVDVVDGTTDRVRQISPDGVASTLAGTDTAGYLDGPVASAQFTDPRGIALGAEGSLYVAEYSRIRRISPDGEVSTAMTMTSNPAGMRFRHVAVESGGAIWATGTTATSPASSTARGPPPGSTTCTASPSTAQMASTSPTPAITPSAGSTPRER